MHGITVINLWTLEKCQFIFLCCMCCIFATAEKKLQKNARKIKNFWIEVKICIYIRDIFLMFTG